MFQDCCKSFLLVKICQLMHGSQVQVQFCSDFCVCKQSPYKSCSIQSTCILIQACSNINVLQVKGQIEVNYFNTILKKMFSYCYLVRFTISFYFLRQDPGLFNVAYKSQICCSCIASVMLLSSNECSDAQKTLMCKYLKNSIVSVYLSPNPRQIS